VLITCEDEPAAAASDDIEIPSPLCALFTPRSVDSAAFILATLATCHVQHIPTLVQAYSTIATVHNYLYLALKQPTTKFHHGDIAMTTRQLMLLHSLVNFLYLEEIDELLFHHISHTNALVHCI